MGEKEANGKAGLERRAWKILLLPSLGTGWESSQGHRAAGLRAARARRGGSLEAGPGDAELIR